MALRKAKTTKKVAKAAPKKDKAREAYDHLRSKCWQRGMIAEVEEADRILNG